VEFDFCTSWQEYQSTARQRHDSAPEEQAGKGGGCDWDHLTGSLADFFVWRYEFL
jgi:hypothetical protein